MRNLSGALLALCLVGCDGPGLSQRQREQSEEIAIKYTTPDREQINDLESRLADAESRVEDLEMKLGM